MPLGLSDGNKRENLPSLFSCASPKKILVPIYKILLRLGPDLENNEAFLTQKMWILRWFQQSVSNKFVPGVG